MFRITVHRGEGEILLAAADADLVGETLEGDDASLHVDEGFYGARSVGADELVEQLATCTMANLVGSDVVEVAAEHGFVDEEVVLDLGGVPHAQMARMREEELGG